MGGILDKRKGILMNTINPFYVILILIIFMWVLDDLFLYFIIEFFIVIIMLNQTDVFGTIPASMEDNMTILLLAMLIIAFAKHAYLANKARNKYNKIVGGTQ